MSDSKFLALIRPGNASVRVARLSAGERGFIGTVALIFILSALVTVVWCESMSTMPQMAMPGGWSLSMTWMRMPGQTWFSACAAFLAMWTVMMIAMMLLSLAPMLLLYRQWLRKQGIKTLATASWVAGLGYFLIWLAFGVIVYGSGVIIAWVVMQSSVIAKTIPLVTGLGVILAGLFQFSPWKINHLLISRNRVSCNELNNSVTGHALRYGLRLGLHCSYCCSGLMLILLVFGVMDLRAMIVVTVVMTVERVLPNVKGTAYWIGVVVVVLGVLSLMHV